MADERWLPPAQQAQLQAMQQKHKLSKALLGSIQAPQAQMVGGQYIRPGLLGGAMPLIQALVGQHMGNKNAEDLAELQKSFGNSGAMGDPAALAKTGKYTAESVDAYSKDGDGSKLVLKPKEYDPRSGIQGQNEFETLPDGRQVQKMIDRSGNVSYKPVSTGTTINMGDGKFDTARLKLEGEQVKELQAVRQKGVAAKNFYNKMSEMQSKVLNGQTYAGPQAELQAMASSFVKGVMGVDLGDKGPYTEYLNRLSKEQLSSMIAGATGRQLTDADVKVLASQFAGQLNSPEAFKLFLADTKRMAEHSIGEYENALQYYETRAAEGDKVGSAMLNVMRVPVAGSQVLDTKVDSIVPDDNKPILPPDPSTEAKKPSVVRNLREMYKDLGY